MLEDIAQDLAAIRRIDSVEKILEVVCRTTGMGFSAVARVTDTRWVACAVRDEIQFGLKPGGELELKTTICDEIRQSEQPIIINEVATDPAFCNHRTPAKYGFQSYISMPIKLPDGRFFGTLCAIDPRPARLNTPETVGMFKLFAELIGQYLDAQDRMNQSERALLDEREAAKLREQFMAVLGHDLRNPINAIDAATAVLRTMELDPEAPEFLDMIGRSTFRMTRLIENVLDFARGRLGGGLSIHRIPQPGLSGMLDHVTTELQTSSPSRTIRRQISIDQTVTCDGGRIAQLLSNLLGNALTHGESDGPIDVIAKTNDSQFELSVINLGQTIPAAVMQRLFEPFARGSVKPGQAGLGLGLYIAMEIARAHDGMLTVESADGVTRFMLRMPRTAVAGESP